MAYAYHRQTDWQVRSSFMVGILDTDISGVSCVGRKAGDLWGVGKCG